MLFALAFIIVPLVDLIRHFCKMIFVVLEFFWFKIVFLSHFGKENHQTNFWPQVFLDLHAVYAVLDGHWNWGFV